MEWQQHAACRGMDFQLFFPVGTKGPAVDQIAEAKAVCDRCPVASECLAWALALETRQEFGIFGGHTEDERRVLLRREKRRAKIEAA